MARSRPICTRLFTSRKEDRSPHQRTSNRGQASLPKHTEMRLVYECKRVETTCDAKSRQAAHARRATKLSSEIIERACTTAQLHFTQLPHLQAKNRRSLSALLNIIAAGMPAAIRCRRVTLHAVGSSKVPRGNASDRHGGPVQVLRAAIESGFLLWTAPRELPFVVEFPHVCRLPSLLI